MTTPIQEQEKGKEQQPEVVLAEILKKHHETRTEQRESGSEWLEKRLSKLPDEARADIQDFDRRLEEVGLTPEQRLGFIDERIDMFEMTYVDKRFAKEGLKILKEEYSKEKSIQWMKDLFDENPTPEDLGKIARLSFDANGLKAVNDLTGSHEKGNQYLRRIADKIHEHGPIKARMDELGITDILPVTGGGDEYSIIVKADKQFSPEDLSQLTKAISLEIEKMDVSDLIDFTDVDTQLRFLGISKKEYAAMDLNMREEMLEEFKVSIPEGFIMRASAPGGAATLLEGMRSALSDSREGKQLTSEDSYERALQKMMGGMWDVSDATAMDKKTEYKANLAQSESEVDKFYSMVLKRTSEAQQLERLVGEQRERLVLLNEMFKSIHELARSGELEPEMALKAIQELLDKAEDSE